MRNEKLVWNPQLVVKNCWTKLAGSKIYSDFKEKLNYDKEVTDHWGYF